MTPMPRTLPSCLLLVFAVCCGLCCHAQAVEYSNTGSVLDLGMGARPLAMGGAFTAISDDDQSLFYNAAGLGWQRDLTFRSSYESRLSLASYWELSASFSHLGLGICSLDFGAIPEIDENGESTGIFSYREYAVVAAAGVRAADLPFLSRMPAARSVGFGVRGKAFLSKTLDPGNGFGVAMDVSLLIRSDSSTSGAGIVTSWGLGLSVENALSAPVRYESGQEESWPRRVVAGAALGLRDGILIALDYSSEKGPRLGVEWAPSPMFSLRGGLRYERVLLWSLGVGASLEDVALDIAFVSHPTLSGELRASLAAKWPSFDSGGH